MIYYIHLYTFYKFSTKNGAKNMLEKINPEFPQANYILSCYNRNINTKLFNKYTNQSINQTNYTDK